MSSNSLSPYINLLLAPFRLLKAVLLIPFEVSWTQSANTKPREPQKGDSASSHSLKRLLWPDFHIVFQRVLAALDDSILLFYTAFLYNFIVLLVKILGLEAAATKSAEQLKLLLSKYAGRYTTARGHKYLFSIPNSLDPDFTVPYSRQLLQGFPFEPEEDTPAESTAPKDASAYGDDPRNVHFLSMCAKLAYEHNAVIQDVVLHSWNLNWKGCNTHRLQSDTKTTPPEISWYAAASKRGLVIVFRGTKPMDLLNWETDIDIAMNPIPDIGRLHNGFYRALFQVSTASQRCVFDEVVSVMWNVLSKNPKTPIFLTGHSLGAALTAVFAAAIHARHPELSAEVAGVYTYGEPRVGDEEFVEHFYRGYPQRCFRYVFAADVIAKAPSGFGYVHHPCERFITSLNLAKERVLDAEIYADEIEEWRRKEAIWAPVFSTCRLLIGLVQGAPVLLSTARFLFLAMPGVMNHAPCEYERVLRPVGSGKAGGPAGQQQLTAFQRMRLWMRPFS